MGMQRLYQTSATAMALALIALPASQAMADSRLTLVVAGEAYSGAPAYELRAGDHVLASGSIDGAMDTESEGYLNEENLLETAQTLEFDIPEGSESVTFAFTNDFWSGPETAFDRNLYVVSATLDGVDLPLDTMKWVQGNEVRSEVPMVHGALALRYFGDSVIIPIAPVAKAADAVPEPAAPEPAGDAAPVPADRKGVAAAGVPPVAEPSCVEPSNFVIGGFAVNSAEIPADALPKLRDAVEKAKTGCSLRITGHASRSGPPEWNQTLAGMRAAAVLAYLSGRAEFIATEVGVGGETADFGSESANRGVRVEIIAP